MAFSIYWIDSEPNNRMELFSGQNSIRCESPISRTFTGPVYIPKSGLTDEDPSESFDRYSLRHNRAALLFLQL